MKTVIRNSYTPKIGDYCETIVVDKETENAYIFDCDGVFTEVPQPVDVEKILEEAAAYTDEQVAPLAEKLDTIEEGAQVNVIETVMKNGTPLTVTNKTVNVTVPTKTSDLTNDGSDGTDTYVESATLDSYYTKTETDTQIGYETTAREIADSGLQEQIDAIVASSDVVDIVGTYAALQAYDTSKLHDNDIIKVLTDETRDDATTYYRWDADTSTWGYIGAEGPFYTKAESDATFVPQTRTINNKALSANISLTASDVGALPDSTVIPTVNDATLTIQKNGTSVATFTANSATNATANITVPTDTSDLTNGAGFITSAALPTKTSELQNDGEDGTDTYAEMGDLPTKTSDLQNDGADGTSTYVEADELATVATTGDYDDLLNKPTIPTVNNATLTIQKNGTDVATFTANSSTNQTANITVPTDTSDLTNGAGFITTSALSNYYTKSETYSQQEVNSLINTLSIPTKTSELVNDGSDGTSTYVEAASLATVATTGDYGDLLNKPTIPSYSDFTGATSGTAGVHGLVPAPAAGDEGKFLQGDGTWATVQSGGGAYSVFYYNGAENFYKDAGLTDLATVQDILDALESGTTYIKFKDNASAVADKYIQVISYSLTNNRLFIQGVTCSNSTNKEGAYIRFEQYANYNRWNWIMTGIQSKLTAGSNISISNNTISASIPVDSALDVSSTNPVQNSVVTAALNGKAANSDFTGTDGLVAGTHGLVPAPTTSDTDKYLKSDGTWATVQGGGGATVSNTPATQYSGSSTTDAQSVQGVYLATHNSNDSVAIPCNGVKSTSLGTQSVSIGGSSSASGQYQTIIGHSATTNTNSDSVAIGHDARAVKVLSQDTGITTIGAYSRGFGTKSVCAGYRAMTSNDYCVAIGGGTNSSTYCNAVGASSVAIGFDATTTNTGAGYNVAIGAKSTTSRASEVSVGDGSSNANYGTRFVANVRDGVLDQDAVTVKQLTTAIAGVSINTINSTDWSGLWQ